MRPNKRVPIRTATAGSRRGVIAGRLRERLCHWSEKRPTPRAIIRRAAACPPGRLRSSRRRAVVGRAASRALILTRLRGEPTRAVHITTRPAPLAMQATYLALLDLAVGGQRPGSATLPPHFRAQMSSTGCTSGSDSYRVAALL